MDNDILVLGAYIILWVLVYKLFNLNPYRNGTETKTPENTNYRREDYPENNYGQGVYAKRGNPGVPPPNEFEAFSVEEVMYGDEPEVPVEIWLAKSEHDSFVEYLRMSLDDNGILMQDLDL